MTSGWREIWDFDDLDRSEERFRALLDAEEQVAGRAAILSQLARIEGLRGRFAEGERLLVAAEESGGVEGWIHVERGRLRRSGGDGAAALPLFEAAFEYGREHGDGFLAGDAAHMAALVGDAEGWTARGIEFCSNSGDPAARYWLGPLLNNVGWSRYESGDHAGALAAFEEALVVREDDPGRPYARESARYAVGKALRKLGRVNEAVAQLERAVAWAAKAGAEDAYFHEELAECYAAAGRTDAARAQAKLALGLLPKDETAVERLERLRALAAGPSARA